MTTLTLKVRNNNTIWWNDKIVPSIQQPRLGVESDRDRLVKSLYGRVFNVAYIVHVHCALYNAKCDVMKDAATAQSRRSVPSPTYPQSTLTLHFILIIDACAILVQLQRKYIATSD